MKAIEWLSRREQRLDMVAGLSDGILTALTLAAGKLLEAKEGVGVGLALRVAGAAAASALFIFFVAHYAELRAQLIHAERQLNLISHGRLATTRLGEAVLREAFSGALLATACSFSGAAFPLLLSALLPSPWWLGPGIIISMPGGLGNPSYGFGLR